MTPQTPKFGETNYEDNPELYEFKIQLGQHVLGMSTATPTWRPDIIKRVKQLQEDAARYRKLKAEVEKALQNVA